MYMCINTLLQISEKDEARNLFNEVDERKCDDRTKKWNINNWHNNGS